MGVLDRLRSKKISEINNKLINEDNYVGKIREAIEYLDEYDKKLENLASIMKYLYILDPNEKTLGNVIQSTMALKFHREELGRELQSIFHGAVVGWDISTENLAIDLYEWWKDGKYDDEKE